MPDDKTAEQLRASSLEVVVAFLLGEGELDGCHFGEKQPWHKGNFWWRNHLRDAIDTRADSGEAVAWQYRMVLASGRASEWQPASKELFDYYVARPTFDDTRIETRELFTHPRAATVDVRALAFAAIEAETELPDDMPDEMWLHLHDDRDAVTEALRITVRQTKKSIRERLQAAIASRNGS